MIKDGTGPFAEALRTRGIKVEARHRSPVEHLLELSVLASYDCLCIHCVQVDHQDIERLRSQGASIAHCPRSNHAHGHGSAPLADFRSAGVRIGLGTDSVVSTGDVNLWDDALAAGLTGEDALRMLTLEGARALGLESQIGSLEVGKHADLAIFASGIPALPPSRLPALFATVAGRVVHG